MSNTVVNIFSPEGAYRHTATKFLCVKTVSGKVVRRLLA